MNPRTPADCLSHIKPGVMTEKEKLVAITRIEQLVWSSAACWIAAERTSSLSDLPDAVRRHAMDTLASVAQSIRAAYYLGQVRGHEDVVEAHQHHRPLSREETGG
jgi:hypothetical protein